MNNKNFQKANEVPEKTIDFLKGISRNVVRDFLSVGLKLEKKQLSPLLEKIRYEQKTVK